MFVAVAIKQGIVVMLVNIRKCLCGHIMTHDLKEFVVKDIDDSIIEKDNNQLIERKDVELIERKNIQLT